MELAGMGAFFLLFILFVVLPKHLIKRGRQEESVTNDEAVGTAADDGHTATIVQLPRFETEESTATERRYATGD